MIVAWKVNAIPPPSSSIGVRLHIVVHVPTYMFLFHICRASLSVLLLDHSSDGKREILRFLALSCSCGRHGFGLCTCHAHRIVHGVAGSFPWIACVEVWFLSWFLSVHCSIPIALVQRPPRSFPPSTWKHESCPISKLGQVRGRHTSSKRAHVLRWRTKKAMHASHWTHPWHMQGRASSHTPTCVSYVDRKPSGVETSVGGRTTRARRNVHVADRPFDPQLSNARRLRR